MARQARPGSFEAGWNDWVASRGVVPSRSATSMAALTGSWSRQYALGWRGAQEAARSGISVEPIGSPAYHAALQKMRAAPNRAGHRAGEPRATTRLFKPNPFKAATAFFYKHAGWASREGLTAAQNRGVRRANARSLAEAEAEAERRGWKVAWEDDPSGWDSLGDVDPSEVSEVLSAVLKDDDGRALASLGSIAFGKGQSVEADRRYGRVIEAELALEALLRS